MIGVGVTYAAMRKGSDGYWAIGVGWAAAVALDALWNYSAAAGPARLVVVDLIMVAALAVVGAMVLADRRRIIRLITGFLPGYADSGAVTKADVEMLASMRWRRLARQWARLHHGLPGVHAMAEYQLAATELALACNRDRRGLMTPEAFARRREDSLGLMRAAAAVFRAGRPPHLHPPWAGGADCIFVPRRSEHASGLDGADRDQHHPAE
jgi:hypothetical protein